MLNYRYNLDNDDDKLQHCIDWVKKQEFLKLFKQTPYFERCQKFRVLNCKFKFDLDAVAQHYEFISHYLDITKDLFIALFFAYTYQKDGQYYPINDFERYSPTLYIGNLAKIYKQHPECLKIIGFQSLLRPHLQKAMAIEIKDNENIKALFEKIELPKSNAFACEVFNKANCGKNLFPNDFISNISIQIRQEKSLNIEFLKEYCNSYKLDLKLYREMLKNKGYTITTENRQIPISVLNEINQEIDRYIIPYLNDRIGFRGVSESIHRTGGIF